MLPRQRRSFPRGAGDTRPLKVSSRRQWAGSSSARTAFNVSTHDLYFLKEEAKLKPPRASKGDLELDEREAEALAAKTKKKINPLETVFLMKFFISGTIAVLLLAGICSGESASPQGRRDMQPSSMLSSHCLFIPILLTKAAIQSSSSTCLSSAHHI